LYIIETPSVLAGGEQMVIHLPPIISKVYGYILVITRLIVVVLGHWPDYNFFGAVGFGSGSWLDGIVRSHHFEGIFLTLGAL
jgi:hypothetical protein